MTPRTSPASQVYLTKHIRGACLDLQRLELAEIPSEHPVRQIGEGYCRLLAQCADQHLPEIDDLTKSVDARQLDFCLVLAPVEADPFIDFMVVQSGARLPGGIGAFRRGELYSDQLSNQLAPARLMELASSMSLKLCRFSVANSARPSALNIRVFRAVLPVWIMKMQKHGVMLAIAPVYATSVATVPLRDA